MDVFQASEILGTCNTIVHILQAIRKCFNARKKIKGIMDGTIICLKNIENRAQKLASFVEVQGIGLLEFCEVVRSIHEVEDELHKWHAKYMRMNRLNKFITATESIATLESVCKKLSNMESEIRTLIPSVQSNTKNSVIMEVLVPLLEGAAEIILTSPNVKQNSTY